MEKVKKLIVITSGSYPYGGAATNRHLSYLKGLTELGVDIELLILQKAYDQSVKSDKDYGVFNGVKYQYINKGKLTSKEFIAKKIFFYIQSLVRCLSVVKKIISKNEDEEIKLLMLITEPIAIKLFTKLSKKKNVLIFHERTEYPFIGKNSILKKLQLNYYHRLLKRFDGLFVITEALKVYFTDYIYPAKIIVIPMTVEPERFSLKKEMTQFGDYIAYCGSMYTDKDGVPILIRAFDIFADKFDNVNLLLIGDNSDENKFFFVKKEIEQSIHSDRIILTGRIERDEMPYFLCNAYALALARPNNIQAKGGFPTKLGEYLATGNPVVVTSVGEIPNYLKNFKNAYVCDRVSCIDFANSLIELFSDNIKANEIGANGKILSETVFNYKIQSARLKEFLFDEK